MLCPFTFLGQQESKIDQFLSPADTLDKKRLTYSIAATGVSFAGMMVVLDQAWYSQFEQGPFQLYNDNDEWLQMDKVGHAWSSYQGARFGDAVLRWSGVDENQSALYGAPLGLLFLTGVEVLDGFSTGWGFSTGDMAANASGTALFLGQELLWNEQRIQLKYSLESVDYLEDPFVQDRIEHIYGSGFNRILNDYNAQTYWLSINPSLFMDEYSSFPKWLNVSLGYSGDGILGGRFNFWCDDQDIRPEDCPLSRQIDFSDQVDRNRQFFLSADIDLTRIETNSPALRTLFGTLNMIKIPAPALELSDGELHLRPIR